jgi:hypothetical protein
VLEGKGLDRIIEELAARDRQSQLEGVDSGAGPR